MTEYEPVSPLAQIAAQHRFDRLLSLAERAGEHVWVATVGYLMNPPGPDGALPEGTRLDTSGLIGPPVLGCYRCEQPWTPQLTRRRCTGDPS